jgi:hypothetical protein
LPTISLTPERQCDAVSDTEPPDWKERYDRSVAEERRRRGSDDDDWLANPMVYLLVSSALWAAFSAYHLATEGMGLVGVLGLILGTAGVWVAVHVLRGEP